MTAKSNRYVRIIVAVFEEAYRPESRVLPFNREALSRAAKRLRVALPKNLGDIIYSFRYRADSPEAIARRTPAGMVWSIRPAGRGSYEFRLEADVDLRPRAAMAVIKIPEATPELIVRYAQSDEQALLARLRYNRLLDVFLGITCSSLQSHLRTTVPGVGQIETDEVYGGVDRSGAHFVVPVQAKGPRDRIGPVQVGQDVALCAARFPLLRCRPVAAQTMDASRIVMFEFAPREVVEVVREIHYQLVRNDEISPGELARYRTLSEAGS